MHGLKPPAMHSGTEAKNLQFSFRGFLAGQVNRQKMPVERTPT
ncbi:methylated-DNA-[]-cysteine S-methyltransferase domain protein [Brucella rhizosphaerae]|uniref:Methylated-DNA-[]-cysteine S-methyltransferase domain protein n=1 Tax=Brucella rhizosphaerae TaxID=571254 RepID=A0A256FLS0_9HYPH|nr:methylated-DNA-[]-cysteine S-methyltransferase domain protein [Brucella rhizosphaerae]